MQVVNTALFCLQSCCKDLPFKTSLLNFLLDFFQTDLDGFKKKKLMEFSIKGPDPASQPLNGKKIK